MDTDYLDIASTQGVTRMSDQKEGLQILAAKGSGCCCFVFLVDEVMEFMA